MLFKKVSKTGCEDKALQVTSSKNIIHRFLKDDSGVTAIEFAFVAIPFFLLIVGILEFGLAFTANRLLDYATSESARLIKTGQAQNQSFDAATFKKSVCDKMVLCTLSMLTVDVQSFSSFSDLSSVSTLDISDQADDDDDVEVETDYSPGTAGEVVIVRTIYKWPMFSALLKLDKADTGAAYRLLYSTAVFRNEPYQ